MNNFASYTNATFYAYQIADNKKEIVSKKLDLINQVLSANNVTPATFLIVGFTPFIFAIDTSKDVTVTSVTPLAAEFIKSVNPNINIVEQPKKGAKYDCVITGDEYFTFANTADEQITLVNQVCDLAKFLVITTLKDYKNLDFKEREFSTPAVVKNSNTVAQFLEYHASTGHNTWNTTVSMISNGALVQFGPFARSAMFFKQVAKFSSDAGAKGFTIHKNLMNKSLIRKNYDHIISIKL